MSSRVVPKYIKKIWDIIKYNQFKKPFEASYQHCHQEWLQNIEKKRYKILSNDIKTFNQVNKPFGASYQQWHQEWCQNISYVSIWSYIQSLQQSYWAKLSEVLSRVVQILFFWYIQTPTSTHLLRQAISSVIKSGANIICDIKHMIYHQIWSIQQTFWGKLSAVSSSNKSGAKIHQRYQILSNINTHINQTFWGKLSAVSSRVVLVQVVSVGVAMQLSEQFNDIPIYFNDLII